MAAIEKWICGLFAAWEMVIDFPLPAQLREKVKTANVPPVAVLTGFPLAGLLLGLALALAGRFCTAAFAPAAGAVLFAVAALLISECKESGRSLGLTVSFLMLRLRGASGEEALRRMNPDLNALTSPVAAAAVSLLLIFKAAMFYLLCIKFASSWMAVLFAGAFAVQGALTRVPELSGGQPMLAVSEVRFRIFIGVCVAVGLIWMTVFPFATLAAGVAVWLLATRFRFCFEERFGGVSAEMITFAGASAELLLLLTGVLFAVRV